MRMTQSYSVYPLVNRVFDGNIESAPNIIDINSLHLLIFNIKLPVSFIYKKDFSHTFVNVKISVIYFNS